MNGLLSCLRAELYVTSNSGAARLLVIAPALLVAIQLLLNWLGNTSRQARDALLGARISLVAPNSARLVCSIDR